jgi:hypothetical protein
VHLQRLLDDLMIPEAAELLAPYWDDSEATFPAGGPRFLEPASVAACRAYTDLPDEVEPVLQETARRVRESSALSRLAWHCYRLLFMHPEYPGGQIGRWPGLGASLGELADSFYILIALQVVPLTQAIHREQGVPEEVTRACCSHFDEAITSYRNVHGSGWGYPLSTIYWLRNYTAGELFTLGRMEYMVRPFSGQVEVYRHCSTGEVVALARDRTRFAADGYIEAEPGPEALEQGRTARLEVGEEAVVGCPIAPTGVALRREVRLPLAQWRRVLGAGDPVLDTHIPAGGGMTLERCLDTMRQAVEFFPRYFPERPFVGFACGSWILNPELAQIYSPTSNMVLWQRELYLFPIPSGRRAGLFFVFGKDEIDPATAPRDTSLRRALLEHLEQGGRLIAGGMFLLTDDLDRFGSQPYLSGWPPSVLG